MGAAIDETALAICIRETLETFLSDHSGLEEASVEVLDRDGQTFIDVEGFGFTLTLDPGPGYDDADDTADAARLVSDAAPDLLAALHGAKEMIRQLLRNHMASMPDGFSETEAAIDAAIAKAEGAA